MDGSGKISNPSSNDVLNWLNAMWNEFLVETIKNSFQKYGFNDDGNCSINTTLEFTWIRFYLRNWLIKRELYLGNKMRTRKKFFIKCKNERGIVTCFPTLLPDRSSNLRLLATLTDSRP